MEGYETTTFDHSVAHEHPERPLGYGAWLCCCRACAVALHAAAVREPGLAIAVKFGYRGRLGFPAWQVVQARLAPSFERALVKLALPKRPECGPDDYVREIYVGDRVYPGHRRQRVPSATTWPECADCSPPGSDGEPSTITRPS